MKKLGWTLQKSTLTEEIAGVDIAGVDNDGVIDTTVNLSCSKTANSVKIAV